MIKHTLFKVYFIVFYTFFPSFGQFVNTTPVNVFPFYCDTFIEPFFHTILLSKAPLSNCVAYQCKQVIIERIQDAWDRISHLNASNVSRTNLAVYNGAFSWRKMTLFCFFRFGFFLAFFQAGNVSNRSIVVGNV